MNSMDTVLIVDDKKINRDILENILKDEYNVLQYDNAVSAIERMKNTFDPISAVILDLVMPGMDGYEFLEYVKKDDVLNKIPVMILTGCSDRESEKKALENGAWDFVTKPFDTDIIRLRVKSVIARSRISDYEKLQHIADYDQLTGIYSRGKFNAETRKMLDRYSSEQFAFLKIDINNFSMINSFYGEFKGDEILRKVADKLKQFSAAFKHCTFGRLESDIFVMCVNYDEQSNFQDDLEEMISEIKSVFKTYFIVPAVGVYVISDNSMSIRDMYGRARIASKKIKEAYMKSYEFYDEKMNEDFKQEQEILSDVDNALKNREFVPYFQPKYDLKTNKPSGAEALVRWIHPEKGIIMPFKFIPLFERNGLISKLDSYMWEYVCSISKYWKDNNMPLCPISVNVSRVNLFDPNFVDNITALVDRYGVDHSLFNLEITESVYADKNSIISNTLDKLHERNFTIMMDDFGSGYSSLNVLKDVAVDVLKLDMRFMSNGKNDGRAENILASVVRMAKWLNMPVIAEGVDDKEQVDFLRGVGCDYIQGYYFAKPMPISDYEKLLSEQPAFVDKKVLNYDGDDLWSKGKKLFNSYEGIIMPMVFLEYKENILNIIDVNKAFYDEYGYDTGLPESKNLFENVVDEDRENVMDIVHNVVENDIVAECEFRIKFNNHHKRWMHAKLKHYGKTNMSDVIIASFSDVTEQKSCEEKYEMQSERFEQYKNEYESEVNKHRSILVVDDNDIDRKFLVEILKTQYNVFEAADAETALDIIRNEKIDLVTLDLVMPETRGEELLKTIKGYSDEIDVVIVVVSSDSDCNKQSELIKEGADDFICKPFSPEILLVRIANLFKLKISKKINSDIVQAN